MTAEAARAHLAAATQRLQDVAARLVAERDAAVAELATHPWACHQAAREGWRAWCPAGDASRRPHRSLLSVSGVQARR